jgi:hypothetical protein
VLESVEQLLGERMTDRERAPSVGDVRWHIQSRNALAQLIHDGAILQLPDEHHQLRNRRR